MEFYFNASVEVGYSTWAATGRQSAAAQQAAETALHLTPEFIAAAKTAWMNSALGKNPDEVELALYRSVFWGLYPAFAKRTNQVGKSTAKFPAGYIAIMHTHPNIRDGQAARLPTAGDGDAQEADRIHRPIYVITDRGLWIHEPGASAPVQLQNGTAWLRR